MVNLLFISFALGFWACLCLLYAVHGLFLVFALEYLSCSRRLNDLLNGIILACEKFDVELFVFARCAFFIYHFSFILLVY